MGGAKAGLMGGAAKEPVPRLSGAEPRPKEAEPKPEPRSDGAP